MNGFLKQSGINLAAEMLKLEAPEEWRIYLAVDPRVAGELEAAELALEEAAPLAWKQYLHEIDLVSRSIMNRLRWELAESL